MKYILLILLFILTSCDGSMASRTIQEIRKKCSFKTTEKRAGFILKCVENANPVSDEEPEDWIKKCQEMAEDTYCPKKTFKIEQWKPCHGCMWHDGSMEEVKDDN